MIRQIISCAIICIMLSSSLSTLRAQNSREINYDETKVPPYVLPQILVNQDGSKVSNAKEWGKKRRPEILEMFSTLMYGRTPQDKIPMITRTISENQNAFGGKALMRQVEFTFNGNNREVKAYLLLILPHSNKKVPVFVGYNFKGNPSICNDTTVLYSPIFSEVGLPTDSLWSRGCQSSRWCIDKIIDRGYGIATMWYYDIYPDQEGMQDRGVTALFPNFNSGASDEWKAIGGWAWGSSRIADYLEKEPLVDKKKLIIMGHSRQGKAALWAGAQDKRFQVVISNDSGEGGAALSKRDFGETLQRVSSIKPSWFCDAYNQYHNNEAAMPFDQHMLLALMAPRKLYVASAQDDLWADPKGEYLAAYYAGDVYKLYGLKGLPDIDMPAIHHPVMEAVGYHIRAGKHDVTDYDWQCYMDFCDKWLR